VRVCLPARLSIGGDPDGLAGLDVGSLAVECHGSGGGELREL